MGSFFTKLFFLFTKRLFDFKILLLIGIFKCLGRGKESRSCRSHEYINCDEGLFIYLKNKISSSNNINTNRVRSYKIIKGMGVTEFVKFQCTKIKLSVFPFSDIRILFFDVLSVSHL